MKFAMPKTFWMLQCVAFILLCSAGFPAEFHVAPAGSDENSGSAEKPFATLEKARDAIRLMKKSAALPSGGVTVVLHEGIYLRDQTFSLSEEDSGAVGARVTYRAAGKAILQAGCVIKPSDFSPVADLATLARLDPAAKGKVLQLDLKNSAVYHTGPYAKIFSDGGNIIELYFNDKRMPLSRWPNAGNSTMAKVLDKGDWSKSPARHGGAFVYREDRPGRWRVENGVWLEGYWRVPWEPQTLQVQAIDAAKKTISFFEPLNAGIGSKYGGNEGDGKEPWCAINLLEEIDQPGEWCLDFASKTLYFWPPSGIAQADIFIADLDAPLITLKNVSHVSLLGLAFEGGLGNGVEMDGGAANLIAGCTLRNLGGTGVIIRGGLHNGLQSSDLFELGQGGVYVGGGDRKILMPAGNFVDNNHFHHLGIRKKTYAPAICLGAYGSGESVGNRVSHNLMHDLPHAAVLYGGNDNLLEYNEVYNVAQTSGDVGAFYTWHDWSSRGNILRHNFVHDAPRCNAFYMDDGDSGDTIFGNVIYRTFYGLFVGGGCDNVLQNNVAIECERAIHLDARGISRGYASDKGLINRVQSVDYKSPPWSEKYPALTKILEFHTGMPTGNVIETNLIVHCKQGLHLGKKDELQYSTVGQNLILDELDAGFADANRLDFTLKSDSPVFKKLPAFQAIPFEKIGLYRDDFRADVPQRAAATNPAAKNAFDSNTDVQRSNKK